MNVVVSGCLCHLVSLCYYFKMEVFSLEEEDYNGLFITQEPSKSVNSDPGDQGNEYEGGLFGFGEAVGGKCEEEKQYQPNCSDISDDEFEDSKMEFRTPMR